MSDTVNVIIKIPKEIYQDVIKNRYIYEEDVEYIVEAIRKATPLDDVKAKFISLYPTNYAGTPEFGGMFCHFSLLTVLEILDNIGKESEENK